MKLLITMNLPWHPALGGANKGNRLLAEAFAARGHAVRAVVPVLGSPSQITHDDWRAELARTGVAVDVTDAGDRFRLDGVDVLAVPSPARLRQALTDEISRFDPDWIIVSSEDPSHNLLDAALQARPDRVVYLCRTALFLPFGPQAFYPSEARTALVRRARGILACSTFLADYIRRHGGIEATHIPIPEFGPGPFPDLGRHDAELVTLINPCAIKGISIFCELARALPEVRFAAVPTWGTTEIDRRLLAEIANVEILQPTPDIDKILARTRVLLVPSVCQEAFGLVIVEAMLRGVPVIASDAGGCPEAKLGTDYVIPVHAIERYSDRLDANSIPIPVVPPQDIGPWRDALAALLGDPALYARQSRAMREAALRFVDGLGVDPFVRFFEGLATARPVVAATAPAKRGSAAAMSPEQRAALIRAARQKKAAPTIERSAAPPRLSHAQQRLWFLEQLAPGCTYHIPFQIRISGDLDRAAFERTVDEVLRRHEVLRTRYIGRDTEAVPIVGAAPTLAHLELSEAELASYAHAEATRPFDLATEAPIRVALVCLTATEHVLVVTVHHIAFDGNSLAILLGELQAIYPAYRDHQPSPLREPVAQYSDYAAWERERPDATAALAYWIDHLKGAPTDLALPRDRPRPAQARNRGSVEHVVIAAPLAAAVRALAREQQVTPSAVGLAAFVALLHRSTGERDLVVGVPVTSRIRVEHKQVIGFFVDTVALRFPLAPDQTSRLLAQQTQAAVHAAFTHSIPFDRVVRALNPDRALTSTPIFQVSYVFEDGAANALELGGLDARVTDTQIEISKFDLTLSISDDDRSWTVALEYDADLFDARTIRAMLARFEILVGEMVAAPGRPIAELPLLADVERDQLAAWNKTARAYPRDQCVHRLFELQVDRTPDAIALMFDGIELTYRELDRRSNQVAHHLQKLGVGPDILVGICVERSLEMVIGLLGILKAGGAYVPLDPGYPRERLAFMMEDAAVSVLVTQDRLVGVLPAHHTRIVRLDTDATSISTESVARPASSTTAEHLAYVDFTSGSTGRPNGACVPHRAVARLVLDTSYIDIQADDVFLQMSPLAFDASTLEVWGPLLNGAKLVILPPQPPSLESLGRAIVESEITILWLTSALFHQMVDHRLDDLAGLRCLLAGGDVLSVAHVQRVVEQLGCTLINGYGPTENTTFTCCYEVPRPFHAGASLPIGRPIANTTVYVLDAERQPVPIGVPGELYTGGDGLARGYLGRPSLTAQKFVPNPFGEGRLYRTGDRVRWLADGTIEFLGRIDQQLKLRGFRIELGEIEAQLGRHPSVREAVVMARGAAGDKRLVAYVVGRDDAPDATVLRAHLQASLPEYMVPSAFVMLDRLPVTTNGKLDRNALPAPADDAHQHAVYVASRTDTERTLTAIWRDVLGVERVGIHDNFFALGGHSLLALRVVSRIRKDLALELPMRTLFDARTLAALADEIDRVRETETPSAAPIARIARDAAMPVSFAEQRLWFLDQVEPDSPVYNIAEAVHLEGALDVTALERSLGEILGRHEALRTTYVVRDHRCARVISPVAAPSLQVIDLTGLTGAAQEAELRRHALLEARRPFDLARGPLLRMTLLRLAADEHVMLLAIHHIVFDAWSFDVLWRELAIAYRAFTTGLEPALPALAIQYADYAAWQQSQFFEAALDDQLRYWKHQLAGSPALLELFTDRPRPAVQTYNGASLPFQLSAQLSDALRGLARETSTTLFTTLLAAFQTLLFRYTRQDDIAVGSPIAHRDREELEGLIGFFVNTLVLRTNLSGDPTFREFLARVREVTLGAYSHQDIPFEKLVAELQPQRSLGHSPLFQVLFVLQHAPAGLELSGLKPTIVELEGTTSKFDLTLFIHEGEAALRGAIEYSTDLYDAATITRMIGHLECLLEGIVADPGRAISDLPMVTAPERRQLVEWNVTTREESDAGVHELFEQQVDRTPDATAVVVGDQTLTYRELDERSNRLASYLIELGVKPDVLVGICLGRSLDMAVALLGVLKAGGAYVPLDTAYPKDRLAYMLADAQAPVLITQATLRELIPTETAKHVLIDRDWPRIVASSATRPAVKVSPDHLVYGIYTSGSTGRPKGIGFVHGALTNLIEWHARVMGRGMRTLQYGSFSFDASVHEMFAAWCSGGSAYIVPDALRTDIAQLARLIVDERIEKVNLPVVVLQKLAETWEDHAFDPTATKEIITTGEQQQITDPVRRLFTRIPGCGLFNHYGPSEAHVVTAYEQPPTPMAWPTYTSIGTPIDNLQMYILDGRLAPVPIGVPGELYIGGVGLARGYLGRPALTADKFVPDPRGGGARLYRTGDLSRYRPDGTIEFLGRIDHQVKIRGFRIELGEVESVLLDHSSVKEAVVTMMDGAGGSRLVAYVVATSAEAPTVEALRGHLQQKLPEYMVPQAFVVLDQLPLTPNGKVDRRALPKPADDHYQRAEYVAPRTKTEQVLAAVWSELLGIERVGIHDNFFALGGHSLLVVRLVARVGRELAVELPTRSVFEHPTIAGQAGRVEALAQTVVIEDTSAERELAELVAALPESEVTARLAEWMQPGGPDARRELFERLMAQHRIDARPSQPLVRRDNSTAPATFAERLHWEFHQRGNFPTLSIHANAFEIRGVVDHHALQQAIAALVERQAVLRTVFALHDGRLIQTVMDRGPVLDIVDLATVPSEQRRSRARELFAEISRPHDLRREVFRAQLVRLDDQEHLLFLVANHTAVDGFSWGVLLGDLTALYRAMIVDRPPALPPLVFHNNDFCSWQTSLEERPVGKRQLAYWARAVAGYRGVELPADRQAVARGSVGLALDTVESGAVPFVVEGETWTAIERACSELMCTPYTVIATGFLLLLARWSGNDDACVLSSNFHRNRPGSELVIGNFVTPYPLRVSFDDTATLETAVRRCHEAVLAHREYGHVAPSSALATWTEWSRYNLNYLIRHDQPLEFGAATFEPLEWSVLERRTSHDLALFVEQGGGGIHGHLAYNAERFSPELATRIATRLGDLIHTIATRSSDRVGALPRTP